MHSLSEICFAAIAPARPVTAAGSVSFAAIVQRVSFAIGKLYANSYNPLSHIIQKCKYPSLETQVSVSVFSGAGRVGAKEQPHPDFETQWVRSTKTEVRINLN